MMWWPGSLLQSRVPVGGRQQVAELLSFAMREGARPDQAQAIENHAIGVAASEPRSSGAHAFVDAPLWSDIGGTLVQAVESSSGGRSLAPALGGNRNLGVGDPLAAGALASSESAGARSLWVEQAAVRVSLGGAENRGGWEASCTQCVAIRFESHLPATNSKLTFKNKGLIGTVRLTDAARRQKRGIARPHPSSVVFLFDNWNDNC
ncbi:MAG: hypothetical protein WBV35_13745 [Steroidobacteraceae bacterium]